MLPASPRLNDSVFSPVHIACARPHVSQPLQAAVKLALELKKPVTLLHETHLEHGGLTLEDIEREGA